MADYYEILGVSRDASQDDIKKAYRKLARKLHPDVAGPDGAERFKDVTSAYDVLSNEEKRRMYDMGGEDALRGGGAGAAGGFGFEDIFSTFFGGGAAQRGPISRTQRGSDSLVQMNLSLDEVVFGVDKPITVDIAAECPECHGMMTAPGTQPVTCAQCGGSGSIQRVTNSLFGQMMTTSACGACQGYGTQIVTPCGECSGEGRVRSKKSVTVKVPAGVENGMRIRLTGQGDAGVAGGMPGDLFAEVYVEKDPIFVRQGDHLHATLEVPMTSAVLGTELAIDTFDGEQKVYIAPGTQSGAEVKLEGMGVGRLHRRGRGDLKITVQVKTPTKLDDAQRALIEELAKLRGEESPAARMISDLSSVFSRLKDKFMGH
ncbi:molecular chaperone DnaJ [Arcanobacterium bovis]|uniref:Chaperone protein DnaJ n=1 Tax=Arcanobacterium bovis TaxID=2529275 RepID=A0A4Q9V035_9ACTO|nr:molecular chaperone DnaJ [Arcanobacterium bovis]TBW22007.1 molecular chaperone DnaJ [Arcanobacterium bovis]